MIKHSILIVILMFLFTLPVLPEELPGFRGGYWAFSTKELTGFRGRLWGSPTPLIWKMDLCDNEDIYDVYPKNLLFKTKIGGATLSYINYYFYKNKFFGVGLYSEGNDNSAYLLEALETKFGPVNMDFIDQEDFYWEGHEYKALYQTLEDGAFVKIWSSSMEKLVESDKRKKTIKAIEETKNAINDF